MKTTSTTSRKTRSQRPRQARTQQPAPTRAEPTRPQTGNGTGPVRDCPVAAVREAVACLLKLPDLSVVDIVLATLVTNELPGDPLWLVLVSPPSNGKTEILMAAARTPQTHLLSTLTKNTLISGQKPTPGDDDSEPSLLPQLTGKTLVLKDFTTILGMHRDERNAILGLLREVYDGKVVKSFGTGKAFTWEGRMGFLAGVTPVFDRLSAVQAILGERFLLYRISGGDRAERRAQAGRALRAAGREKTLREQLGTAMCRSYDEALRWHPKNKGRIIVPRGIENTLVSLADLAALGRSGVIRDGYSREIKYFPEPEGPGRLVKQLRQLALGLTLIHGKRQPDEEELATLRKVARDTMHPFKARVLAALTREEMDIPALQDASRLTYEMVQRELEDCTLLGLTEKDTKAKVWRLTQDRRRDIDTSGIFAG